MCDTFCIDFGERVILPDMVKGKNVLEVGALNVNGSLQEHVKDMKPKEYIAVDIENGPCVDEVCDVLDLKDRFEDNQFHLVISTEMMEHVEDWRTAIQNMKDVLRPGGYILITTRMPGFPFHEYPHDYWRYTEEAMQAIFSDYEDVYIETEDSSMGIFVLARKLKDVMPTFLSDIELEKVV